MANVCKNRCSSCCCGPHPHTGVSLGRCAACDAPGTMSKKEIEENYAISRRIEAEERGLETASMVITSTQQEIDEQWGLYDGCAPLGTDMVLDLACRAG